MIQMSYDPARLLANAIFDRSGDHDGASSSDLKNVSCVTPLPSGFIEKMSYVALLLKLTNAIFLWSTDHVAYSPSATFFFEEPSEFMA